MRPRSLLALAMILGACSNVAGGSGDPANISVFFANDLGPNGAPGTTVITWLTPGTVTEAHKDPIPCSGVYSASCPPTWYGPGFRTDVVQPHEHLCVHFVAPSDSLAAEFNLTAGTAGNAVGYAGSWQMSSAWGFDGSAVQPAGTIDSGDGTVVQGC